MRAPAPPLRFGWGRFLSGLTAICANQAVYIAGNLAIVPLFLSHWPTQRYGEWLALSSLAGYLSTLDMGMNTAGGNRLTQEYARGDFDSYRRYQHSAMAFYGALTLVASAALGIAVWLLPIVSWLGLRTISPKEAAWVAWLLGAQILWAMPAGFVMTTYRTMGDLARTQWIKSAQNLAALGIGAVLLLAGGGMISIACAQLLCLVAGAAAAMGHLWRRRRKVMPGVSGAELSVVRELAGPSLLFGLITLAQAMAGQAPVILITTRLGAVAVAVFVITRTLANSARQIANVAGMALWPQLTALDARSERSTLRALHRVWMMGSSALGTSVAAALWFEGTEVIRVWTRGKIEPDVTLLRLLLLQVVLQTPWLASSLFPTASNQHRKLAFAYLGSSVLGLLVAMVLIGRMGVSAVPVGCIAGESLLCYHFVIRDSCASVGESYRSFAGRQWWYLARLSAIAFTAGWGVHQIAIGAAPLRWMEVGAATTMGSMAALWAIGLRAEDRSLIKQKCRLLLGMRLQPCHTC